MDLLLFLIETVVVAVVICTARVFVRGRRHKPPECVAPLRSPRLSPIDMACPLTRHERQVKPISISECEKLVYNFDNVVFIALRQGSERIPLPFPAMHAVSVAPSELVDILKLIPDCFVVLCGEVDLGSPILDRLEDIARSRPVYVLEAAPEHAEVA